MFRALLFLCAASLAASELTIDGTRFLLDGKHFPWTGVSFFNAVYNPAFNKSSDDRRQWLRKFQKYGINVIRVWGQWDSGRGYVDDCKECSFYYPDGRLRQEHVDRLKAIVIDAAALGMVVEVVLFSQESWHAKVRLGPAESDKAVAAITRELMPHRNLVIQIWNEFSERVLDHLKTIKGVDPKRIVTNSPGVAGVLGDVAQNSALDFLTPHTTRSGSHWEIGPKELAYLQARFNKPIVDDEPARNGTRSFGGPRGETFPSDHILQIWQVWQMGMYVLYHHDMFQTGYGTPPVPPSGIPDPEYNPYHREVFEFLARRDRYLPRAFLTSSVSAGTTSNKSPTIP